MNIAAYCRVSTDKDDQLNSLDAQKRFFEEYTKKNNQSLVRIYADEGISGTKIKNRKEFLRLLRDAQHGIFDTVVVKDISRFARNTVDFLNSIRQLKALGIETVFLTSNQTVLGNSEFVLTIFGALAQEESANTSKRVKFGKKLNAQKGRVPNLVYGYDKTKGEYFSLSINKQEAGVVRRIFELYTNDGYGANKIAGILNADGVKTKRNCRWTQVAVARILSNELYTGKVINGKQEVEDFLTGVRKEKDEPEWFIVDKPELRIIDDEVFIKASKILSKRQNDFNVKHERQSNKHLFSTLIKCAGCGYSFRRTERVYQNTYIKWVCSGRNANGADSCKNLIKIDEQELMSAIREHFKQILDLKPDALKSIVRAFNRIYQTKDDNAEYETNLNERLQKANKSRQKYMDMYNDDLITREELKEKLVSLNAEIEKIENELTLIKQSSCEGDKSEILSQTLSDIDSVLSMEHITNLQLRQIIQKIVVDEHGVVDVYFQPFSDFD